MPTINQLVRKPRKSSKRKAKHIQLARDFNPLKNRYKKTANPFKRGVCLQVKKAFLAIVSECGYRIYTYAD